MCPAVIALDIQSSFGISGTLLGVLSSAYFYAYAFMQMPTGLMADSWGPRKTVSSFFVLAGIGAVLMGIAPNLPVAIFGRILVGLGVSTVFVCNFKLISEWFSKQQFVMMGGAFMAMGGIGALSSGAPLAWMSDAIGWRMTLVSVGIVTLIMAALVFMLVRDRPSEMGLPPVQLDSNGFGVRIGLVAGLKMVFGSGRFWPVAIWAFNVIGISFAVGGLWGGPYLMQVYDLSKAAAGGVLSTFALALIVESPLLGWLANRFGRRPVLTGCSLLLTAACGLLGWFIDSMAMTGLYILFFCIFLSGGAVGPVIAAVSKELFPVSISGTAVGAVNLFPFIGAAIFQVLIGTVLTSASGTRAAYTLAGFRYMFVICLAGSAISLVAAVFSQETLPRKKRDNI